MQVRSRTINFMLSEFSGEGKEGFQNVLSVLALEPIWIGIPFMDCGATEGERKV